MNPTFIRLRRIKRNRTQVEIATEIGISYTTYGAVESGRRPVSEDTAQKIAKALGVSFDKAFEVSTIGKGRYQAKKEKQ